MPYGYAPPRPAGSCMRLHRCGVSCGPPLLPRLAIVCRELSFFVSAEMTGLPRRGACGTRQLMYDLKLRIPVRMIGALFGFPSALQAIIESA